ncbi:MAG: hypothetical protein F2667_07385 [Actinobacteria bacterium]|uniref:Unannotated protein n=1 Tax=freshwater metagenome TaxID=449393 RepID=A0A6J6QGF5_9ZZZZ|nr:hypothetical protein [Actinomycetota bacterium]
MKGNIHMSSAKQSVKRVLALSTGAVISAGALTMVTPAANAATGDSITVASVSPVRNGGSEGAKILLRTKGVPDSSLLKLVASDLNIATSLNTPNQTIGAPVFGATIANGAPGDTNTTDGLDEISLTLPVTTSADGGVAKFAIFEDEATAGVDATEARVQVELTTAGAPTSVTLAPAAQTSPLGVASGAYTVAIKDAGGRATQLTGAENFTVNATGGATSFSAPADNNVLSASELSGGSVTFTATGTGTTGLRTISVAGGTPPAATIAASGTLDVVGAAAGLTNANLDVVTGADSYAAPGDPSNVSVRVDQASIKLDIVSAPNAGKTVSLAIARTAGVLTFGGKTTATLTTVLDAAGKGSITITPDAGTVTDAGQFTVNGAGLGLVFDYDRAQATAIKPAATTYVSKFGGSVDVTATVTDQFGLPITGVLVTAQRTGGVNADATESAKKAVGADGKVTFTLTDTKASVTNAASDTVNFKVYQDSFAALPLAGVTATPATIVYSVDGNGADFIVTLDGANTAGAAYDPASITVDPLSDAIADNGNLSADESTTLATVGGTSGSAVTVTADNGALVLKAGETTLAEGAASKSGVIGQSFRIVGTKSGVVTVTTVSAGITKTAKFTVKAGYSARNVAVTAPAKAIAGDLAVFTAKITDAFGNPIPNYTIGGLNVQVSGPGALQDTGAQTNAAGELALNVRVNGGASAPITVTVTGLFNTQFGAAANRLYTSSTTNDAPGLGASTGSATATVTDVVDIAALQAAVDAAQADVDAAQAASDAAVATLATAKADKAAAQKSVAKAKKAVKKAQGPKAKKAAKAKLKKARAALQAARADVTAAKAAVTTTAADLAAAQAKLEAAKAALADAQN